MEKKIVILIISSMLISWHWFQPVPKKNSEGIKSYKKGQFNNALENFLSAKGLNPHSDKLRNNTALALYNLKKFDKAIDEFSKMDPKKLGINPSDFFYNIGDTYFRLKNYKKALENFKKSLKINPDDLDAKKNFEITLKKMEENKRKKNSSNDKNKRNRDNEKSEEKREKKSLNNNEINRYKNILKYLNRKEKEQLKKKKRKTSNKKNEKDW